MAYIANHGKYPAAVTFCKMFLYNDESWHSATEKEILKDIDKIEVDSKDLGWTTIYTENTYLNESILPNRIFSTFSWTQNAFKLCLSIQLEMETLKLSHLRFQYKWSEYINESSFNKVEIFVHGWGSYETIKTQIVLNERSKIYQLSQETIDKSSTDSTHECFSYTNVVLDECLALKAISYANVTVGCVTDLLRYA